MNKKEMAIAIAIGNYLHKEYDWNVFGGSNCKKCKKKEYLGNKFCPKCGTKLEPIPDESACREIYEAYCKGKKVDEIYKETS